MNEDGRLNSPDNPAKSGSTLALLLTGEGLVDPLPLDGQFYGAEPSRPVLPISAEFMGHAVEVVGAGGVPGQVAGLLQVKIRVPEAIRGAYDVEVKIGEFSTTARIAVTPAN